MREPRHMLRRSSSSSFFPPPAAVEAPRFWGRRRRSHHLPAVPVQLRHKLNKCMHDITLYVSTVQVRMPSQSPPPRCPATPFRAKCMRDIKLVAPCRCDCARYGCTAYVCRGSSSPTTAVDGRYVWPLTSDNERLCFPLREASRPAMSAVTAGGAPTYTTGGVCKEH